MEDLSLPLCVCLCLSMYKNWYDTKHNKTVGDVRRRWHVPWCIDVYIRPSSQKKKPAKFRWFLVTQKRRLKNIFFFSFLKKHKMKSVWAKKKKQMVGFRLVLNVHLVRFSLDGQQLQLLSYSIHEPVSREKGTVEQEVHSCVIYKYIVSKHLDALWL